MADSLLECSLSLVPRRSRDTLHEKRGFVRFLDKPSESCG